MSVIEAVLSFDGTHVEELRAAVDEYSADDGPSLMEFCFSDDPKTRVAATWIVKAVMEKRLDTGLDLSRLFERLEFETDWAVLLHLLQCAPFDLETAGKHREAIERHLEHKKTLVAVWALDAFVRIAQHSDEGLEEARMRVETAFSHDKASMRARARHLAPLLGL